MLLALTTYSTVKALHIMAAVIAYGLPLSAPAILPYLRRAHPGALAGFHDVQHRMNTRVTGPFTILLFLFGAYMASKQDLWGELWVEVPLAIFGAIVVLGGWIVRRIARLAELARDGFGPEYDAIYRRYLAVETLLGVLVLVAIFFMAAKPGA